MDSLPKVLGIVGARSGSKSIPHKNIRALLGKPLLAWIIEAAKRSPYVTRLILSTDSPEYAAIGRQYGAETPFLRPAEFASDTATDMDYLSHAASWLETNEGWVPDIILRLPPTSPLCATESINACIEHLINDSEATSARTITTAPKHPYKLWQIQGEQLLPFIPKEVTGFAEPSGMARQFYSPAAYSHVDVIAVRRDTLMEHGLLTGPKVRYHVLKKEDAIDIDTEHDFLLAEILLKRRAEPVGSSDPTPSR
ncbi:MAG: acylneuraminate cytidylyltransferase family protein [bacterium]|nr:acylneuraminate cytidylyltransferase family protein [bacterium]MDZ4284354.1 acylneuraminate cytidylyltransferase family protein [Patescibacteria group bacterium]